jgi:hypothetical protein
MPRGEPRKQGHASRRHRWPFGGGGAPVTEGIGGRVPELGYMAMRVLELAARAKAARSSKNTVAVSSTRRLWRMASPW